MQCERLIPYCPIVRKGGCCRQVAALHSDHYRQVPLVGAGCFRQVDVLHSAHYRQVPVNTVPTCEVTSIISAALITVPASLNKVRAKTGVGVRMGD